MVRTTQQTNPLNNARRVRLNLLHEYLQTKKSNTPDVLSTGLVFRPPANTFFALDRIFKPVIKLYDSNGDAVDPATRVFVARKRPSDSVPTYVPGEFPLFPFNDLSTSEQRVPDNAASVMQDLGANVMLRENEDLLFQFDGADAIDFDQPGSAFEFMVYWASQ